MSKFTKYDEQILYDDLQSVYDRLEKYREYAENNRDFDYIYRKGLLINIDNAYESIVYLLDSML